MTGATRKPTEPNGTFSKGFPCPECGARTGIIDGRYVKTLNWFRRRHACLKCPIRFTSYERMGNPDVGLALAKIHAQIRRLERAILCLGEMTR